jgi:lysophospholipase L1-like esterase
MKPQLPKRICVIGASSVEGDGVAEGSFFELLHRWILQIDPFHHHVYNLGVSGNATSEILNRFEAEVTARRADFIIFMGGANDSRHKPTLDSPHYTSPEDFAKNYAHILSIAKRIAPVLCVGIFPIDDSKTQPISSGTSYFLLKDVKEYAELVKNECQKLSVPYLDTFSEWIAEDYKQYLAEDGLHPNVLGHQKIFTEIKHWFEENYQVE